MWRQLKSSLLGISSKIVANKFRKERQKLSWKITEIKFFHILYWASPYALCSNILIVVVLTNSGSINTNLYTLLEPSPRINAVIHFKVNCSIFEIYLVCSPFKGHTHNWNNLSYHLYGVTLFYSNLKIKLSANPIKCILKHHVQDAKHFCIMTGLILFSLLASTLENEVLRFPIYAPKFRIV